MRTTKFLPEVSDGESSSAYPALVSEDGNTRVVLEGVSREDVWFFTLKRSGLQSISFTCERVPYFMPELIAHQRNHELDWRIASIGLLGLPKLNRSEWIQAYSFASKSELQECVNLAASALLSWSVNTRGLRQITRSVTLTDCMQQYVYGGTQ